MSRERTKKRKGEGTGKSEGMWNKGWKGKANGKDGERDNGKGEKGMRDGSVGNR